MKLTLIIGFLAYVHAQISSENGVYNGPEVDASASAKSSANANAGGIGAAANANAEASAQALARNGFASSGASAAAKASSASTNSTLPPLEKHKGGLSSYVRKCVKDKLKCGKCEKELRHVNDRLQTYMKICGPQCPQHRIQEFVKTAIEKEKSQKTELNDASGEKYVALLPVIGVSEIRGIKPIKKLVGIQVEDKSDSDDNRLRKFKHVIDRAVRKYLRENPSQINNTAEVTHYARKQAQKHANGCKPCQEWMKSGFDKRVTRQMRKYQRNFTRGRKNKYIHHFHRLHLNKIEQIEIGDQSDLRRYTKRVIQWCLSHKSGTPEQVRGKCRPVVRRKVLKKFKSTKLEISHETIRSMIRTEFRSQFKKFMYYEHKANKTRGSENSKASASASATAGASRETVSLTPKAPI